MAAIAARSGPAGDLRDPRSVEDRPREARRGGIELTDVANRGRILSRAAGVGANRGETPPWSAPRVVEADGLDPQVAGSAAAARKLLAGPGAYRLPGGRPGTVQGRTDIDGHGSPS